IGTRHSLPVLDILTPSGHLNDQAGIYAGLSREEARLRILEGLEREGFLEKTEPYHHNVGHSERTDAVVEPRLSDQWFVRMRPLAELALQAVEQGEIQILPERFLATYRHWLENVKDWCISRQLWWGHRIPAWYAEDGTLFVAPTEEEAKAEAAAKGYDPQKLHQEEDVLDTWFSSWLWPLSVFDFFENPDNADFRYYYPTQVLITAPEILFFWVARMIMAGYYFAGKKPFSVVYLHGIVRDKLRRKMSKSLGNSPDPLDLIARYGADAVRMGIVMSAPAGNDLLFDEALCEQGKNFANKLWNSFRLLSLWREKAANQALLPFQQQAYEWFVLRLKVLQHEVEARLAEYRFYEALHTLYRGIWEDFCSWYLEALKPGPPQDLLEKVEEQAIILLQLLHPFMPYITEELWHALTGKEEKESVGLLPLVTLSSLKEEEKELLDAVAYAQDAIMRLRGLRQSFSLSSDFDLSVQTDRPGLFEKVEGWFRHFLPLRSWTILQKPLDRPALRLVFQREVYFIEVNEGGISWEILREKLEKELAHVENFLHQLEAKLSNPTFRQKAAPEVIAREEKKRADTEARRHLLLEQLHSLQSL
ncbi:MAG: class I tRNA ligase family protein, partial [Bacteroidia bacterium]|nr:class I tRNA ligase family protein [Bacteroidia bacterium]